MQRDLTYVGIDVAKEMLDVALRPAGERWRVAHDAAGLEQLVARLPVAAVRPRIEAHIAWLEQERSELEDELRQTLQQSPVRRERDQLLRSVPGVGEQLSLTLLARAAGAGSAEPPRDRRPGWRGALQPRQRQAARQTHDLGRGRPTSPRGWRSPPACASCS